MKKLRWAMDGDFWELDVSTPRTLEGTARAVPGDPLPLGLSRGTRLSRPKQIDFFQRFMTTPCVPSYSSGTGFTLQRVLTIPFAEKWISSFLGQFNMTKFVSSMKENNVLQQPKSTWVRNIGKVLKDKTLYALGFSSDFLLTSDDTLLVSLDSYGDNSNNPRKKAVFYHRFPHHDLTVEAVWPGLFVDKKGNYWEVPLSMAVDLASVAADSGASYHLSVHHNDGSPEQFEGDQVAQVPATLLPGFAVKSAFSYKKNVNIWKSKAKMLPMVQPYDIFLSNPQVSASGIIGAAVTAAFGENSVRSQVVDDTQGFKGFSFHAPTSKSSILADTFASLSFTAQLGNFQRLFADLTRFHARLDFLSGSKFLSGANRLAQDYFNSRQPSTEAVKAICPRATLSLQQQIAGPFSFRVDSGVLVDIEDKNWSVHIDEPVFALEYALQVLGSAKAVAWYSPKHKEFMIELRFFET
ncbi:hypothetical protein SLA2020_523920 [Shorea laevis]